MGIYLGIDPSTKSTGYGVVNDAEELIGWGVIEPNKKKMDVREQAVFQYEQLKNLIEKYQVTHICCEDQFNRINADTFKKLSRISGYIILLSGQLQLPIQLYPPKKWRKIFHGDGKAKKEDTLELVNRLFNLDLKANQNDIADAIGIAIAGRRGFQMGGGEKLCS